MKILQNRSSKNKFALPLAFFLLNLFSANIPAQKKTDANFVFGNIETQFNFPFENCWTYPSRESVSNIGASDNAKEIYITTDESELISINLSGKIEWKSDLGGAVTSNLLVKDNSVYLVTKSATSSEKLIRQTNTVRSINRFTGVTNWTMNTPGSEKVYLYGFQANVILLDQEGFIKCVKTDNGRIVWEGALGGKLSAEPFFGDEKLFAGTFDRHIAQWSLTNGKQISKLKVPTIPTAVLISPHNGNLYWGDNIGSVFSIKNTILKNSSKNPKTDWQLRNGGKISHLTPAPGGLLVSSFDNFVYLISYENGEIVWKKRFAGRISSEPFIVGGFALVMTTAEPDVSVIELSSGRMVNKVSLKSENGFTNNPVKIGNQMIFPTLEGVFSFSPSGCANDKKEEGKI